ncbi:hypothetical protein BRADI_1g78168v3 [Brachypodium distachyon]|uniref:Uncharacterized protein n=1 Tax=Brachypodium distachyon TaxID=15368 RepID=A0A0Q3HMH7_BRADI|nr:hypothetical protein BRADI_1g78168v3 [Brachypodium distachyon]
MPTVKMVVCEFRPFSDIKPCGIQLIQIGSESDKATDNGWLFVRNDQNLLRSYLSACEVICYGDTK